MASEACANRLRAAVEAGADEEACQLLGELQAAGGALTLGLPTFEELAARDLPHAAVAAARLEASTADLQEAEATPAGGSYLHAAAAAGAGAAVIQALVDAGCTLDGHDGEGDTPLHAAAAAGHLATCEALLAAGADVFARNGRGRTARLQGGVPAPVKAALEGAEARARQAREALFSAKLAATQTQSACRLGCL